MGTARPGKVLPPTLHLRERLKGRLVGPGGVPAGIVDLRLRIAWVDAAAATADLTTPADVEGTVTEPALSADPLRVTGGLFRLLVTDLDQVDTRHMTYELDLEATDGRRFHLSARKDIHDESGCDAWLDTTNAAVLVTDEQSATILTGDIAISLRRFLHLLLSMKVDGGSRAARPRHLAAFQGAFVGALIHTYGDQLAQDDDMRKMIRRLKVLALPGGTRPLRLPLADVRWCGPDRRWSSIRPDGAWLRLTRYHGGDKGPVLLAPGFAMSTAHYVVPTIETNLAEHLVENGYDVWLFDYRASTDLSSARTAFTIDDLAHDDWPTAVDEVRAATGSPDVQVIAHCVGSLSLQMALLAGMIGVRSAICSQVTVHPVMHWFSRAKAGARVSRVLAGFGMRTIEPGLRASGGDRLLDLLLELNPLLKGERCHNPVCRWVCAFFGPTHEHAQLNDATHAQIASLFGVGGLQALDHLALIVRSKGAVDHRGRDVYLPNVERMALPITFLVGDHNRIFLPDGTDKTLDWLRRANDPGLYERLLLPGYAHLDALIGRDAARDVFPHLVRALDAHPAVMPRPVSGP